MQAEIPFNQQLLGNKWEEFEPIEAVSRDLYTLSEMLGRQNPGDQSHGIFGGEWGYGQDFENAVVEMHPYWWGDCECGFEESEYAWSDSNKHTATCFNTRYQEEEERLDKILPDRGMKSWEGQRDALIAWSKKNGYPDAPNGMAVYCDCGHQEAWERWRSEHDHAEACRVVMPNFRHKASGYAVHWYKYIGRGMTANQELGFVEWQRIYEDCRLSLKTNSTDAT